MPRPGNFRLAIVLGLLSVIAPFAVDMYLPSFPTIVDALHSTPNAIQASLAVYFIGMALGQLVFGPLSDRLGRRGPLLFGGVVLLVGSLACALAQDATQLIIGRGVQAVGGCAAMVISRAIVRDLFEPREGARFYSYMMLVSGLGPVIAPMFGGVLLLAFGWRSIFIFLALWGVLWLFLVTSTLPESLPPENRHPIDLAEVIRRYKLLLHDRTFISYVLSGGLISAAMFAYIAGTPFVFIELHGVRPEHFGFFFGVNAAGIMTMGQLTRTLVRLYDMNHLLRRALAVAATATILVALSCLTNILGFPGLLVPLFFTVASMGIVMPLTTSLAMAPHATMAGNASALFGVIQFSVSGISALAVSALNDGTAVPMGVVIAVCGVGALGANLLLLGRREKVAA